MHSITQIVCDRITENAPAPGFLQFLFNEPTAREITLVDACASEGKPSVLVTRAFGRPRFKVGDNLRTKTVVMSVNINGKAEKFEFGWDEFFKELVRRHGDEPLVSRDTLGKRFLSMDGFGRPTGA